MAEPVEKKIEGAQRDATAQALGAIEKIPAKTNLPQLAIEDANNKISNLQSLSRQNAPLYSNATKEANEKINETKMEAGTQQLQLGLSMLENAAASVKNEDAKWLAQRGAEYLEAGAYGKAYACLVFGNSLLVAPGNFEEGSATGKIREAAGGAQGMGAKGLEELFSSGKAGQLIDAYNIEIETDSLSRPMLALMDSGARIQRLFGKEEAAFIFMEAAAADELSRRAAELSQEGKLDEAQAALGKAQLLMGGIGEYVAALELRRGMRPPARGGEEEYAALVRQAEKSIVEIRSGLATGLEAAELNAENVAAIQRVFAENSYSLRMASAQAELLRLEASIEGYTGTAAKRLREAVDFASEKIKEGKFEDAKQAVFLAIAYKETFEKSAYSLFAEKNESLDQARRAAELKPGEDALLQGRMKLGRALDFIISNGESEKGREYDIRADLLGSATLLASVKAGAKHMESPLKTHEETLAEAKKNGIELDSSGAEKEFREMNWFALKGDAWGVWTHGVEKTSVAVAKERSDLYSARGAGEVYTQVAAMREEALKMNKETWSLANSLGANADELRAARTLEEGMKPKALLIASNAEVVEKSLRDQSWKLEELDMKTEAHLGKFAGKTTPEAGREGKEILGAQLEGIERSKYLVQVGTGMNIISRDALSLMQITLSGGESLFAGNIVVRRMSFMNLDRAMGELADASYAICGIDTRAEGPYKVADAREWKRNSNEAYNQYKEAQREVGNALAVQWSPTLNYETGEEQRAAANGAYSRHKQDLFASVVGIEKEKVPGSAECRAAAADSLLFASYTISSHPLEVPIFGSTADNFNSAIESMRRISSNSNTKDVVASVSEMQERISDARMNYAGAMAFEETIRFMGATLTGPAAIWIITTDMLHAAPIGYLRTGKVSPGTFFMFGAMGLGKIAGALNSINAAAQVQKGLMLAHNVTFTVLMGEGVVTGGGMFYEGIKRGDAEAALTGAKEMFKALPFLFQAPMPHAGFLRWNVGAGIGRGISYFRSPAPTPEVLARVLAKPEAPSVIVDLNAPGPGEAPIVPERVGIPPLPTEAQALRYAVENSFSGKRSWEKDGRMQSEYFLQDGAATKIFSEKQVGEIGQAIHHAEKIVRGEVVQMPPGIIPMANRLSVEPEFVRATEVIDALRKGGGANYDPRTISGFYEKSRGVQISLARAEWERNDNRVRYEAEVASRKNFAAALGEVREALKANKGREMAIEFSFGEWKELVPGESVRVHVPAEGGGLRAERIRIVKIEPAKYEGGQYVVEYTIESTGKTGMLALDRNAGFMEAHNALAAKTLIDVRAFEKAGAEVNPPAEAEADSARAALAFVQGRRGFGEVWEKVAPKVQAMGNEPGVVRFEPKKEPTFVLDISGKQVGVRLDEVRAVGGNKMYLGVTPMAGAAGKILVPARRGQSAPDIMLALKRNVGLALERKTVGDPLISAALRRIPEGERFGVGEARLKELARRGLDEVYGGRVDETPLSGKETDAYEIIRGKFNNRFNAVAEIAFEEVVAERAGKVPKLFAIFESERPAYGRMKKLMETVLDANKARIEEGAKPDALIRPSEFVSDYRVYLQRGIGLPKEVAEAAQLMGVKTKVAYEGNYVTEVRDAPQFFAIGDIHGDPVVPISTLKGAGVIIDLRPDLAITDKSVPYAERYRINPEIAEGTQIIFTGDYIDRGVNSLEAVEFVQWLQGGVEALGNGSRVHTLRGNHEALFLRAFELCKGKSDAEMAQLARDMREYANLSDFLRSNPEEFEKNPQMERRFEELETVMEKEFETHGLAILNIGLAPTFEGILNRYGSWSVAMAEMQTEGGMVNFMRNTKAAVMITGNNGRQLFTHAGPATKAERVDADGNAVRDVNGKIVYEDITTVEQLDRHYERMLGNVDNWWAFNAIPRDPVERKRFEGEKYERTKNGDYSPSYVAEKPKANPYHFFWSAANEEVLLNLQAFAENMNITSITVGHKAGPNVRFVGSFKTAKGTEVEINCIDGALSEPYMKTFAEWSGGILYENAWEGNSVVQGRRDAPGKIEQATELLPFGSPMRMDNAYTDALKASLQAEEGRAAAQ